MSLEREPIELKDLLNTTASNLNLANKKVVVELRKNINEIMSNSFSKSVTIYDLVNGNLILKVDNPIWKTEIQLRKDQIVEKFNSYLGANIIKNIVLQ